MKRKHLLQKMTPKQPLHAQVLFTILAFLAMAVLSYVFMSTIMRSHLVRNSETLLTFQRAGIETSLVEFRTPLELTAWEARNMILRGEDAQSIRDYFVNISSRFDSNERHRLSVNGLVGYFETLPDGPAFITSLENQPETVRLAEHPWYGAAIRAGSDIAETVVYDDMFTEEAIFVYSRCIYDDEGRRLGVVGLRMVISAMGREVIETALAQGGYGMLLSRDLVMIAHPHQDFVGRQLHELDVTIAGFAGELRRGLEISERPVITFKNEGAVAFFRKLSNGWYLGLVTPNGTYYQSARLMMVILGILALTFATALIGVLISIDRARKKSDTESKHKSVFLANMSHEIRTPMNAIIGMTSIGKTASDAERKDYCFTKIEDASNHLLGVINDILDMSKIEANRLELSPVEFNFEKMLQRVVNVVNFRVDEKQQKFMVYLDRAIPKVLIGDDQRLAQVITNLLGNAVKFTPEYGSVSLDIRLMENVNDYCTLQFSVTDTGIGISPEQQVKLFKPFQQAEADTTRKFGGTGLGLTISKSIVEMMGGKIWVDSRNKKGVTFSFTVQLKQGAGGEEGLLAPGVNWDNIRIMAVDDDPVVLVYFKEIAQGFNVFCDTAISGKDALRLVERNGSYHIYFVDWKMPEMDGVQLAAELKSRESSKSVVIMISSAEFTAVENEAKKAGVDKFLSKPLFPSAIAEAINECLGVDKQKIKEAQTDIDGLFEGHCILLAEDVDINREIVLTLLEPTLLKIDCAENGAEAIRMFSQAPEKYGMIFMDGQMPEMDGYEATRSIRVIEEELDSASETGKPHRRIPIIAMTANVFREDVDRCLDAGMDGHVGKPLDFEDVLDKLRLYLQ
jgi:signal transduction histidine kinase/DNA-binding response OmpR family regulator